MTREERCRPVALRKTVVVAKAALPPDFRHATADPATRSQTLLSRKDASRAPITGPAPPPSRTHTSLSSRLLCQQRTPPLPSKLAWVSGYVAPAATEPAISLGHCRDCQPQTRPLHPGATREECAGPFHLNLSKQWPPSSLLIPPHHQLVRKALPQTPHFLLAKRKRLPVTKLPSSHRHGSLVRAYRHLRLPRRKAFDFFQLVLYVSYFFSLCVSWVLRVSGSQRRRDGCRRRRTREPSRHQVCRAGALACVGGSGSSAPVSGPARGVSLPWTAAAAQAAWTTAAFTSTATATAHCERRDHGGRGAAARTPCASAGRHPPPRAPRWRHAAGCRPWLPPAAAAPSPRAPRYAASVLYFYCCAAYHRLPRPDGVPAVERGACGGAGAARPTGGRARRPPLPPSVRSGSRRGRASGGGRRPPPP